MHAEFCQGNLLGNIQLEDRGDGIWIKLALNNISRINSRSCEKIRKGQSYATGFQYPKRNAESRLRP
jgi:hypothetical protein